MDYAESGRDLGDGVLEVREPVAVYGGPVGAEPVVWDGVGGDGDGDVWDDGGDSGVDESPEFKEYVYRILMEAEAKNQSGRARLYTTEEVFHSLWLEFKEETKANIAAGRLPPQPKEFWDELEEEIENTRL